MTNMQEMLGSMGEGEEGIATNVDIVFVIDATRSVACETCTTTGYVMVMGEITSNAHIDFQQVVRDTVREIGYDRAKYGFDADTCAVVTAIDKQSTDIAMGVDKALEAKENNMSDEEIDAIGAGDQGMMFGFATNETEEYMPYPIYMAHKLARQLTKVRKDGTLSYLRPDGKTQVTVEYDENGKPFRLDAVVLSTQHDPEVSQEQIHEDIKKYVFDEIIPADMVDEHTKFFINPTGRFVIGGPHGDSGLTGRKIIVDTYGGYARHGGGAFSGKDCTKVDRSAAYAARYVAKNIVAAGLADKCEVQLSYAIGVAHPTSIMIDSYGTGKLSDNKLTDIVRENFDRSPRTEHGGRPAAAEQRYHKNRRSRRTAVPGFFCAHKLHGRRYGKLLRFCRLGSADTDHFRDGTDDDADGLCNSVRDGARHDAGR